jgi:hypothetical protein
MTQQQPLCSELHDSERKIREVRKILEELFSNIIATGVSTVRHTRRQGKKQVSGITSALTEGKM